MSKYFSALLFALLFIFALLLLIGAWGPVRAGAVYQWEEGGTHFSDTPPPHQPEMEAGELPDSPRPSGEGAAVSVAGTVVDGRPEAEGELSGLADEVAEMEVVTEYNPERCRRATEAVDWLKARGRIRAREAGSDEVRYLTPDEKAAKLQRWEQIRERHC
ncbi:MAG: DUF4124 domain-containing protein [Cellvibrionales bacterium]|nr:DUF4124 domain-containing protein [Cellvibrionales bacterium]